MNNVENRKKKVLIVNSLDERYGSTYRARAIFAAIKSLGMDCTYIESNFRGEGDSKDIISINQKENVLSYLMASIQRTYYCLKLSYDICIIQKVLPLTILSILTVKFIKRKSLIVDWDDLDSEFQSSRFRKLLTQLSESLFFMSPSVITTHSNFIREFLLNRNAKDIFLIPQIVDEGAFNPGRHDTDKVKNEINLNGRFVVGYLVTFTEGGMRDMDKILEMYKDIEKNNPMSLLLIIGGGPLQQRVYSLLQKYNIDSYKITGIVSHEDVPYFISGCDICLIYMRDNPGNMARVSLKLLEYLSMKKPVIGKITGETKSLLGDFVLDFEESKNNNYVVYNYTHASELMKEQFSFKSLKESLNSLFGNI